MLRELERGGCDDLLYDLILARHVLSALLFDLLIATSAEELEAVLEDRPLGLRRLHQWLQVDASESTAQLRRALPSNDRNSE